MYFRLNPECYFIRGEECGAIFDLIDGKAYSLNPQETKLIASCERNELISSNEDLLKDLKNRCIGNIYENRIYMRKLDIGSPLLERSNSFPQLQKAYLEINNSCNRTCWFCGYYGIKRSLGCIGCNKWKENGEALTLKRWKKLIEELNNLDCKAIFLKGGDLTLSWDKTMSILNYAKDMFKCIYITLHQQSISERIMNDLENKAELIIQCEDFKDILPNAHTILLPVKPEDLKNITIDRTSNKNIVIDLIIQDTNHLTNILPIISERNMSLNMYNFLNNMKYHPCLGHTLAICYNGDIIPCPTMRNHKLGNIKNKELYTIFENKDEGIYKFWNLNLDKVEKCKFCEFRYACTDCRSIEEHLSGRLDSKILCSYDPKRGTWQ